MSYFFWGATFTLAACGEQKQYPINRKVVVDRHKVNLTAPDTLGALTVGNGRFAFTVDITGLQSFPEIYQNGIPLGTQSDWGWHSAPNPTNYTLAQTFRAMASHGRKVPYPVQWKENEKPQHEAATYFRENPHRLQLGNIGFDILKSDSTAASLSDITQVKQELDLWTGEIKSSFVVENEPVVVNTLSDTLQALVAVKVKSRLLKNGRLRLRIRFPYPSGEFLDNAVHYGDTARHTSSVTRPSGGLAVFTHELDSTRYYLYTKASADLALRDSTAHNYLLQPEMPAEEGEFVFEFSRELRNVPLPAYSEIARRNRLFWERFWTSGGFIDFSAVEDPRGLELERRIILSLYQTRIQCAGDMPPQETGLTQNSWYGRPHLEMHWWHSVHFALWGRPELLENSMKWYFRNADKARLIAERQGFEGVRWPKMTDPWGGEAPSSVGSYLIWQQPHFIYFAELLYRSSPGEAILRRYADLVFQTADFMASFAWLNPETGRYMLGKGVIPAQERFKPEETYNPSFELAYWYWGLTTAQKWRERMKLPPNAKWEEVRSKLSRLPVAGGVYLAAESAPDSYTNPVYKTDHPIVLGALGMLPEMETVSAGIMRQTFEKIWKEWNWEETWGWDFPMVAMTATRLGDPERAVEALLREVPTNRYLVNGHNYQDKRLRLYLPGNGALLTAAAMMAGGYGEAENRYPGFPKGWKVKAEGIRRMP